MDIHLKKEKRESKHPGTRDFFCILPHDNTKENAETPKENKVSVYEQAGNHHKEAASYLRRNGQGMCVLENQILEIFRRENSELTGSQDSPS